MSVVANRGWSTVTTNSSIVALIPARGGSKRVSRKNIRRLGDHPLLAYTLAAARQSGVFGDIFVSTEDPEIERVALDYGADVVIRPAEFAADDSPDIAWLRHALVDCHIGDDFESFALLRPTSPLRTADTIRRAWSAWKRDGQHFHSLRAIQPVSEHAGKMWTLVPDYWSKAQRLEPFHDFGLSSPPAHSRATQSLPPLFIQNASLEIAHVNTVIKKGSISGTRVMPFFTERDEGFDLNSERDWLLLEFMVERGLATLPEVPR